MPSRLWGPRGTPRRCRQPHQWTGASMAWSWGCSLKTHWQLAKWCVWYLLSSYLWIVERDVWYLQCVAVCCSMLQCVAKSHDALATSNVISDICSVLIYIRRPVDSELEGAYFLETRLAMCIYVHHLCVYLMSNTPLLCIPTPVCFKPWPFKMN